MTRPNHHLAVLVNCVPATFDGTSSSTTVILISTCVSGAMLASAELKSDEKTMCFVLSDRGMPSDDRVAGDAPSVSEPMEVRDPPLTREAVLLTYVADAPIAVRSS